MVQLSVGRRIEERGRCKGNCAAVGDLHLAQTYSQVSSMPAGDGHSFAQGDGVKRHLGAKKEVRFGRGNVTLI